MGAIVFIWEVALLSSLLVLLFMMQDWSKIALFKKYIEKKQRKKDEEAADKLLDDLPKGITRYKEKEISQK
ncbi:MAG: hypothetical protein COZ18_11810 [Flexibacter sp. CG_4_10_14_3_um_filter_32_15]|nr:MAG: hypothetical protein COZ18_11810 [Flexibacter sp. CG_4_10_14_3_um_filter_32_15]